MKPTNLITVLMGIASQVFPTAFALPGVSPYPDAKGLNDVRSPDLPGPGRRANFPLPPPLTPEQEAEKLRLLQQHLDLYNSTGAGSGPHKRDGGLERRIPFNPRSDACRVTAVRDLYWTLDCTPDCKNGDYYNVEEVVVSDNNSNEWYAHFRGLQNGGWKYYQLDGHRGIWMATWWQGSTNWYGFGYALMGIEGRDGNRDMMGSHDCWYDGGSEFWGQKGRASCFVWCNQFNW
ncbi:hypothetical protein B0T14DRAFT_600627 [Immersiella caudata]|uniref:Uncharacterized protein n=1 Tax=Immersiella caudata TaxID=314043 RepID=A0AA39X504_9PEZI|nr:hypothetical protein B0T14DRAFT_600627 [Immersiella caudata]